MIRKTINHTKECTFIVRVPGPNGFPYPVGTGFFISGEGYFITAYHVIEGVNNFSNVRFQQPDGEHVLNISLIEKWEHFDIALLKADLNLNQKRFEKAKNQFLNGKEEFPHLIPDFNQYFEGTPIYTFGFPLPKVKIIEQNHITVGLEALCPRVTSAIISSIYDYIRPIRSKEDTKIYTIDKPLHPGNSGGPAILSENGKVFGVCVASQLFSLQKLNIHEIQLPANYGFVVSLENIKDYLLREISL